MNVDISLLNALVEQKYLTVQHHSTADLLIYNYTTKTQAERYWTPETMMCRGLITKPDGTLVARPFPKFFNLEEHPGDLPIEPFQVFEKLDGSLGILFFVDGKPYLATRGSFTSDQAIRGNVILERYQDVMFDPEFTYLFEIIYADNRIVVDYGDREDLVLLAAIHTESGEELDISEHQWPFPVATRYDGITDLSALRDREEANREGFVIRFAGGTRVKVKFAEYVRLHRLVTGVNAKTIWELLANNQSFDDLLERVPDEFYQWVRETKASLTNQFAQIEADAAAVVDRVKDQASRREQAEQVLQSPYSGVAFSMLDGKDYRPAIWKLIRPRAERPFTTEI